MRMLLLLFLPIFSVVFFVFFFKQKTAYEMRISDWSSDVCSSDLADRSHGYCIDDNARALLLCCGLAGGPDAPLARRLSSTFAAFIQHGWNPGNRRFRNFMGFDRRWLEDAGSEDSPGRMFWAPGP